MSNFVSCPHCNHSMSVAPGTTAYCESCGKQFTAYSGHPMAAPADASPGTGSGSNKTILIVVLACVGVVMLMCGGIMVALLLPAVQAARSAARRVEAGNDLKMIALAMHNYHDTYKMFPPIYIPNEDGTPRTSWRTSILPFMEHVAEYERYDFNANWDAPANAWTATTSIDTYHSSASAEPPTTTNYFRLTGPGTMGEQLANDRFIRIRDCTDGTANTLMIIEIEGLNVPWPEPRDITLPELQAMVDAGQVSPHIGGFQVAMCDGSVKFISLNIDRQVLSDLAIRNDGNQIMLP